MIRRRGRYFIFYSSGQSVHACLLLVRSGSAKAWDLISRARFLICDAYLSGRLMMPYLPCGFINPLRKAVCLKYKHCIF